MPLDIREREEEGISVLDLKGRIIAGPDAGDLRRVITLLIERQVVNVIFNLKEVDYIDSTGLGTLVIAHSSFEKAGGAVKLLHVSKRAAELMILTKLSTVFVMFDDEQAAVDSFFPDRDVPKFDILEFVKTQERQPEHLGADSSPKPEPSKP